MLVVLDTNIPPHVAATRVVLIGIDEHKWGPLPLRVRRLQQQSEWLHTRKGIIAHEVRFAVALALNKKELGIEFAINGLIEFERWNVRPARDQAGRDIWSLFDARTLPTPMPESFVIMGGGFDFKDTLRMLSRAPHAPRLHDLIKILGEKNSQDAFTLWNSEQSAAEYIVTIDAAFVKLFNKKRRQLNSSVSVSLPSSLSKKLGVRPVPLKWFAMRSPDCLDEWLEPEQPS